MDEKIKTYRAALKAKLEALPEGLILVRSNSKTIGQAFEEIRKDLQIIGKRYRFVHAPANWNGSWRKVDVELLREILIEMDRDAKPK